MPRTVYHAFNPAIYLNDRGSLHPPLKEQLKLPFMSHDTVIEVENWEGPAALPNSFPYYLPLRLEPYNPPSFTDHHPFIELYGYEPFRRPACPQQTLVIKNKDDVKSILETQAVQWLEPIIRVVGSKNRPFFTLRNTPGLPWMIHRYSKLSIYGPLNDVKVDFAFVWGCPDIRYNKVLAVMQSKAVGTFNGTHWHKPQLLEHEIAKEARAYAVLFNTRVVLFYDGITFVCFEWPRFTDPLVDKPERVAFLEFPTHSERLRPFLLRAIFAGLDDKVLPFQWL